MMTFLLCRVGVVGKLDAVAARTDGPVVFIVTVAPVVAISAAAFLALAATMPPVPAVRLIDPAVAIERRARAVAIVEDNLARAGGGLKDIDRGAAGGGRRGGR